MQVAAREGLGDKLLLFGVRPVGSYDLPQGEIEEREIGALRVGQRPQRRYAFTSRSGLPGGFINPAGNFGRATSEPPGLSPALGNN